MVDASIYKATANKLPSYVIAARELFRQSVDSIYEQLHHVPDCTPDRKEASDEYIKYSNYVYYYPKALRYILFYTLYDDGSVSALLSSLQTVRSALGVLGCAIDSHPLLSTDFLLQLGDVLLYTLYVGISSETTIGTNILLRKEAYSLLIGKVEQAKEQHDVYSMLTAITDYTRVYVDRLKDIAIAEEKIV